MSGAVLVWDRDGAPPEGPGEVWLWRAYAAERSVPARLEANAERLRAKYLAFVRDIGQARVDGRRIVEHLSLDGEFSFWWMTWIAEKSPFKSPGVYACLRVLAFEEVLRERRPARVELESPNDDLAEALGGLCAALEIAFARRPGPRAARRRTPSELLGAAAFARQLATRRRLGPGPKPAEFASKDSVLICSFFAHLDSASCARGEFRSRYWDGLPDALVAGGKRVNWLQQFVHGYSSDAPNAATSLSWLARFNADAGRQGFHAFLESCLTPALALAAFRDWRALCAAERRLRGAVERAFVPEGSAANLWPLLRDDWRRSLSGPAGALNCLWARLFDAAFESMPRQELGLYLYEGQGWEAAFLRAWRRHGHGTAIAVAHSTVPFWHLYNFDDPRVFADPAPTRPQPDRLAVNGPAATRVFAGVGHPAAALVEVEALRYLGLSTLASVRAPESSAPARNLLVVGDVIAESMSSLLANLEGALKSLPSGYRITLKPHPLFPVDAAAHPGLPIEKTTAEGLDRILGGFDAAIAANSTSACVDAHLAGLPVIVGLNGSDLNLSPLRGEAGVRFVGTAAEMADALANARRAPAAEFFHLDANLPRWRRLLGTGGHE